MLKQLNGLPDYFSEEKPQLIINRPQQPVRRVSDPIIPVVQDSSKQDTLQDVPPSSSCAGDIVDSSCFNPDSMHEDNLKKLQQTANDLANPLTFKRQPNVSFEKENNGKGTDLNDIVLVSQRGDIEIRIKGSDSFFRKRVRV